MMWVRLKWLGMNYEKQMCRKIHALLLVLITSRHFI